MRILQISTMTSYYGGEVHLAQLAAGMQTRGHEVLCVVRPESELAKRLPEKGLAVETMPLVDWFDPLSVARLTRLLRSLGPGILHSHMPRDYFLAAVASLGTEMVNVGTRHQLRPISHTLLKRPFLNRFAAMIAVSEGVRKGLAGNAAVDDGRLHVIHHGLPPSHRTLRSEALRLRLQIGAGASDPVVGFVGRLSPDKGVQVLISALSQMMGRWPHLRACLIGDEESGSGYRAYLEELIAALGFTDRFLFTGYREDAARMIGAFDIQVVPSVAEPFGLVTLEAMSAGLPVVGTRAGGTRELVRDGVEGFLFEPADVDALARKLEILVESPGLCREMGLRGKKRAQEEFSYARMLDATEAVYRQAMGTGQAAAAG